MNSGQKPTDRFTKKWRLCFLFFVFCFAIALLFIVYPNSLLQDQPSSVPAAQVQNEITCLGRLLPGGRILQVAAPSGAVVKELLVKRGQWVNQGDILARLRDYAREKAALEQAEKEAAVAMSELDLVRAGEKAETIKAQKSAVAIQESIYRKEQAQYERSRQLYEKRIISDNDFDEALSRRDTARESLLLERQNLARLRDIREEDVTLASKKVEAAEAARMVAAENVELNIIRAPVLGQVLEVHAYPGEAISDQGLLEMGSGREMLVEAEVSVSDIGRVRIGAPAAITGDAFPGTVTGRVTEITSLVTRGVVLPSNPLAFSDLRIVNVWIQLDDPTSLGSLGNHQVAVAITP